jgi:predicted nucleic acid-binding protein
MIVLDNDVLAEFRKPDPKPSVVSYLQQHRTDKWLLSAVVLYEFLSFYSSQSKQNAEREKIMSRVDGIVPLDAAVSAEAASIEASLDSVGVSLDTADLLIAATAREHSATLATGNKNDFDKPPIRQLLEIDLVDT